jgi:hypothetical protein
VRDVQSDANWNVSLYKKNYFPLFRDKRATLKLGGVVVNVFNQGSFNGVGITMGTATFDQDLVSFLMIASNGAR